MMAKEEQLRNRVSALQDQSIFLRRRRWSSVKCEIKSRRNRDNRGRQGLQSRQAGRVYVLGIGVKGNTSCETVVEKETESCGSRAVDGASKTRELAIAVRREG